MSAEAEIRYAPDKTFPPYAFHPGEHPHPTRDPKGHSYSPDPEPDAAYFDASEWERNEDYLFGVDLYNHGFLWEAHEAWEGLWHQAKHDELQREMLQGLIQCTAASLKVTMGQPRGVARLSEIGTGRLEHVAKNGPIEFMGLDLLSFIAAFRAFAASEPESADERPRIELS